MPQTIFKQMLDRANVERNTHLLEGTLVFAEAFFGKGSLQAAIALMDLSIHYDESGRDRDAELSERLAFNYLREYLVMNPDALKELMRPDGSKSNGRHLGIVRD